MNLPFSPQVKRSLQIAASHAKEHQNEYIHPGHLLKAVLHKDIGLVEVINALEKDYYYLLDWADARIQRYPKSPKPPDNPAPEEYTSSVLSEADNYRLKLALDEISPMCVLASLCTPGVGFNYEQLKSFIITNDEIIDFLTNTMDQGKSVGESGKVTARNAQGKADNIQKYCYDKLLLAQEGLLDPTVGFEKEIMSIMEVLGRKSKSNLLVIGESGVGKTALLNGLIFRISDKNVPGFLSEARVYEIDTGALIAGANYKGEAEDRLKNTLLEIKNNEKAIIVIENIDSLLDKHNVLNSLTNILKQELSRGEIILIGTSSVEGYTKYIETDAEFNRNFEQLKLAEPDESKAYRIIREVVSGYETHHNIQVDKSVVQQAIKLSKRYLSEKRLPESAIDLIDRTLALVSTTNEISLPEVLLLREKMVNLKSLTDADDEEKRNLLKWFVDEVFDRISYSLISKIDQQFELIEEQPFDEALQALEKLLDQLEAVADEKKMALEESDLLAVVAKLTGIPVGKIQTKERDRLLNAETHLQQRVVGQDHAIKSIIEAIFESRAGLSKKGQPIGSFFFLGPTGTGKTELAKALAEFLFQDESSMIRFDMSEFKEEHSAALLYGAPPGYVGYEEGGMLVNKIRNKPYSVVLFDEIEKAHPSVFDIFLQILDEGKLHDRLGREGDFSNALVLFTSNIGSEHITRAFGENRIPKSNELMEIMANHFRPEFLGRLTEIVPFAPISDSIVQLIFDIHLKGLLKTLEELKIELKITPEARKHLATTGFSSQYGARPILGIIRNQVRRPLARMVIAGKIARGAKATLGLKNGALNWQIKNV